VLTKLEEERRREDWIAPDNSFRVLEVIAGSYSGGKRAKGREREREREREGGGKRVRTGAKRGAEPRCFSRERGINLEDLESRT